MQLKKFLKILIFFLTISFILFGILLLILFNKSSTLRSYLEKSNEVKANLLIIEAWLPDTAIEIIKSEILNDSYDLYVTAGIQSEELDYCLIAMNGYLIFYPKIKPLKEDQSKPHKIGIVARSEMGGKYSSHFNLFINDSIISDFYADEKSSRYDVEWFGKISEIDSLAVQFTNDYFDDSGDRNLYIKEFIIDDELIIPYQFNSVYDIGKPGGNNRIVNDYNSHSEMIRNKLITNGVDPSKIFAVTGKRTRINRTLNGALAFNKWLKQAEPNIVGINIITMSIHSRRTLLTYRKVLDNHVDIGVIPLPVAHDIKKERPDQSAIVLETLRLLYYWIILLPY